MRFVIVGAGRVGLRTARVLSDEGHDVTVIERDATLVERLAEEPFTVMTGDGSSEEAIEAAGIAEADALGALTGDLNTNFVACLVANHHGCRTVLRIDEEYREAIYRKYASEVDEVVYPERLGAIVAKNALLGGNIQAIADVAQNLQMVQLTVTHDSPMQGYSLSELELPSESTLLAFGKADDPLTVPQGDQSLEVGDRVVVLADFNRLADVRHLIVGDPGPEAAVGGV